MSQSNTRCQGGNCPSKQHCQRYTDRNRGNAFTPYAAFWARREAGATACDQFISSLPSTFEANPSRAAAEKHCTYPACSCPFDAPADPNWCARGYRKKGGAA